MTSTLRDRILVKRGIRSELVSVAALGEDILVKGLAAGVAFKIQKSATDPEDGTVDNEKFYPALVIATACDPASGHPIFGIADRDALLELGLEVLEELARKAMDLSGLGERAAKAIEGNSVATASGVTASDSPSGSE